MYGNASGSKGGELRSLREGTRKSGKDWNNGNKRKRERGEVEERGLETGQNEREKG